MTHIGEPSQRTKMFLAHTKGALTKPLGKQICGNDTIFTQGLVVRMDLLTLTDQTGRYLALAPPQLYLMEDDCGNLGILVPGESYINWYQDAKTDEDAVRAYLEQCAEDLRGAQAIEEEERRAQTA